MNRKRDRKCFPLDLELSLKNKTKEKIALIAFLLRGSLFRNVTEKSKISITWEAYCSLHHSEYTNSLHNGSWTPSSAGSNFLEVYSKGFLFFFSQYISLYYR